MWKNYSRLDQRGHSNPRRYGKLRLCDRDHARCIGNAAQRQRLAVSQPGSRRRRERRGARGSAVAGGADLLPVHRRRLDTANRGVERRSVVVVRWRSASRPTAPTIAKVVDDPTRTFLVLSLIVAYRLGCFRLARANLLTISQRGAATSCDRKAWTNDRSRPPPDIAQRLPAWRRR